MTDSHENESHSTKAKSLHFPWQPRIDFSYALLKRYRISQGCRSWSWSFLKAECLHIFSWVTGTAFLQSHREGQRCHLCNVCWHCGIFWGAILLLPRMKYTENNLLTCCNSDAFRFEILSDQSSPLWNSLIKNKSAVFIKCLNLPLWLEEHTREGFVEM